MYNSYSSINLFLFNNLTMAVKVDDFILKIFMKKDKN